MQNKKWIGLSYEELAELSAGMHSLRKRSKLEKEMRSEMSWRDSLAKEAGLERPACGEIKPD